MRTTREYRRNQVAHTVRRRRNTEQKRLRRTRHAYQRRNCGTKPETLGDDSDVLQVRRCWKAPVLAWALHTLWCD